MAGPLWQQLLDFLRLQETLDAIAAGSTQANVDIEALRASLESAAKDVPAIRNALDFVKAVSETPGTEAIGGVGIFRSAAFARGARGADLERAADALRKRVFEGKESLDAVRREAGQEVVQEVRAQVAEKLDLFGPEFVAIVRGAAIGAGAAILAQLRPEERPLGMTEATWRERLKQPFYSVELKEFEKAYQDFETWRKGVRAQVYGEVPSARPALPEPELLERKYTLGESIEDTARHFYEGDVRAKVAYQSKDGPTLDKSKALRDDKGQVVYAKTVDGAPIWLPTDELYPQGALALNILSEVAFVTTSGDTAKTSEALKTLKKVSPDMRLLVRSVLPKVFERFAPPTATRGLVDAWVSTEVTNETTARRNAAVALQEHDELENIFGILNGRSPTKEEGLLLYGASLDDKGQPVLNPVYGEAIPDSVKRAAHYRGIRLPSDRPGDVVEGNTLSLPEVITQLERALAASQDVEFKKPYYGYDMLPDRGKIVAAAQRYMALNAEPYARIVESQRTAKIVMAQGEEPTIVLGHGEPVSPDAWLAQDSKRAKTDRDLYEAAEDAKKRAEKEAAKLESKRAREAAEAEYRGVIDALRAIALGQGPNSPMRRYIYNNLDFLAKEIVSSGMSPDAAVGYWQRIDIERKKEDAQAARVTWADIGGMPKDERAWAALGYYSRGPDGRLRRDSAGIELLTRQPGESVADYWTRAQGALGEKTKSLPPIEGMPKNALEFAGLDTDNPANLLAGLYRTGTLGVAPMTPQNSQDLWRDYQTMVEFQAQQVAPNQQEAYRNVAAAAWPRILAIIDARLGIAKAKGDPAEIAAEEAYRKQQAAEMIRQTDVPAMVGVRKVSSYSTAEEVHKAETAERLAIPRAQLPLQEIAKREAAIEASYREVEKTQAFQRVHAAEESMRAGADPGALAGAIAWEAQMQVQREAFQREQELRPQREAAARLAAEELERTRPKPQPFRPTFWRFGPTFGRR